MTFRLRHLIAALVLHAALLGVLLGGLQCTRKPAKPPVIQAVLLDPDRKEVAQQKRREEQRRVEQQRKAEAEAKRREEEQRRRVEAERKHRELEQRQAEEARRQRELAEQKKAEEQARRQKEQQEQRERDEQARREIQERARMEEAIRQEALRREIERERAARAASEREVKLAEWTDALSRHIARNWVRPAATAERFECTVRVQQLPDGTVTYARIVKSCGNSPLDKSVEDAVFRASPLPRPSDPSVFDRDLTIIFVPES